VDPGLRPAPIGAPGELCIGGVQLARGYLHRPALTAERFVPDPFSTQAGARMYRTGDLARHRATGQLEFLGRLDHQVKLRGLRIELGEIEAALRDIAGVRDAVVLPVLKQGAVDSLAAFVILNEPPPRSDFQRACELKGQMIERLPAYMIPRRFSFLESFPMNANGKADRRRLAEALT